MSLWELAACVAGYNRANAAPEDAKAKPPSAEEHRAALRRVAAANGSH